MNCEIICVGTEILLGNIVNTNAAFLSAELAKLGINVFRETVVGDNSARLAESLRAAFKENDIVITSGGLGPTYDDLTKETAAEILNAELLFDEESMLKIEKYFEKLGRKMTPSISKQAYLPKGSYALPNDCGTAPGVYLEKDGKILIMLPGPPRELQTMFVRYAVPKLAEISGKTSVSHTLHIIGAGESNVETKLRDIMTTMTNPTVAPYAKTGQVEVRVTAFAETKEKAEELTKPIVEKVSETIGSEYSKDGYVYGIDVKGINESLVSELKKGGLKIATAESITGGMISKMITEISGSSAVLECGICSYSNRIKHELLGVKTETLENYTEYSSETAIEMSEGVRRISGADIGISTTGIAGPEGGTAEKPVGLVYIGISSKLGNYSMKLNLSRGFDDEREIIRELAAVNAISLALGTAREINKISN